MILHFDFNTPVQTTNYELFPHGIIMTQKDGIHYFYSSFIDCNFDLKSHSFEFNDYREPYGYRAPIIREKSDTSGIFANEHIFNKFCETNLNDGWYITGNFDEFYIPERFAYNEYHKKHDYLIIGYDSDNYYLAGYTSFRKPKMTAVPKKNMFTSVSCCKESDIWRMKADINYRYFVDLPYVYRLLKIYRDGGFSRTQRKYFGITSTAGFIKSYEEYILRIKPWEFDDLGIIPDDEEYDPNKISFDARPYKRYIEHKKLLLDRFIYFSNRYNVQNVEMLTFLKSIYENSYKIFMLTLKVNIKNDRRLVFRILDYFKKTLEEEEKNTGKLINYTEVLIEKQKDEKFIY